MTAQMSLEQREIIEKTANHIISREDTSEHSQNLKAVAELALFALTEMDCEPQASLADQTAAKEKLLDLLQRGIDFQSAEVPVNATSAPMQPLEFDDRGTLRFKENKIVRRLLDHSTQSGYGLNEIALEDFTDDDRMQLAQLIGYSLSGYGELSYVSDESWERAAATAPEQEE